MRYFLEFAYQGTTFNGFQVQPGQASVQALVEQALATILKLQTCPIVGCGRTDAGVHARQYFAHFDAPKTISDAPRFIHGLNALLGYEVVALALHEVPQDAHARFDAVSRSYEYYLSAQKNPFRRAFQYTLPKADSLDWAAIQALAAMLLDYEDFAPFCKTHTDAQTRRCRLSRSQWVYRPEDQLWVYEVSADRFLRGMIRLIVGASVYVGQGKLSLEAIRQALETQSPLPRPFSAPAEGLFLTDIRYPYIPPKPALGLFGR